MRTLYATDARVVTNRANNRTCEVPRARRRSRAALGETKHGLSVANDDSPQEAAARAFRPKQSELARAEREAETEALLEAFRYRSTRTG